MTQPTQQAALDMAREAEMIPSLPPYDKNALGKHVPAKWIEALVAAAYKRGAEDEREACADTAKRRAKALQSHLTNNEPLMAETAKKFIQGVISASKRIEFTIRNRSKP